MSKKIGLIPKENLVKRIGSAYSGAARSIVAILRDLDPMTYTDSEGSVALSKIRGIVDRLDALAAAWAVQSIKAAYGESQKISRTRLEAIGAEQTNVKKGRHEKAIKKMARLTMRDYLDANRTILKNAGKYLSVMAHAKRKMDRYREDVKAEAFSSAEVRDMIDSTVRQALRTTSKYNAGTAHLTSKTIARKIMSKLMGHLEGQDFIVIKGKDGKERNYNLRSYSEMVARTRMREAQSKATIEMCKDYDNDLVQWSQHSEPCPDCALLEGQIFSISGKHPEYPALTGDVEPPLHPNCEHNLNPTSDNALHWRNA